MVKAGVFYSNGYTAQRGLAAYLRLHSRDTGQDLTPESACSAEGQVAPVRRTEVQEGGGSLGGLWVTELSDAHGEVV